MSHRLIIFDVDSTLLSVESLDFAVERALSSTPDGAERAKALSQITDQGMAGEIDFRTSLVRRIAIAGLTKATVSEASEALRAHLTPGMAELLSGLRAKGAFVRAVSGGFVDLIAPALGDLEFEPADLFANAFVYGAQGDVIDFDRDRPTSRSQGKAEAIHNLKSELEPVETIMVGDGMTDHEAYARGAADHFVGFGGVVSRPAVKAKAAAWAGSVEELDALLA